MNVTLNTFIPSYLHLESKILAERLAGLREIMRSCRLCPRNCGIDRITGETGFCGIGAEAMVASYGPHFGEERPLSGRRGSGTIFLSRCNLRCVFCQNYDIAHLGIGSPQTIEGLARIMLDLQAQGCHNINWVTPTHQVPMLVEALQNASVQGLRIPMVYNCGGYESVEVLKLLKGIVDIYMPDAKYGDNAAGKELSGVPDYWDRNRKALAEMHRQVGDLEVDDMGIARRGLLVRHLVLPNGMAGTSTVMQFLASLSTNTYVNVMAQYRPECRAREFPAIARPIAQAEFKVAIQSALDAGLHRLDERRVLI